MTDEIVTVKVMKDGANVGKVNREKGDYADIPRTKAEILENNDIVEIKEDVESAAEANDKEKSEKSKVEKNDDDSKKDKDEFVATVHAKGLPEGEHKGTIIDIEKKPVTINKDGKKKEVTYLDLTIEVPENEARKTVGYNFYISESSQLGGLLKRFGENLNVGNDINVFDVLLGEPVKFYVQEAEGDDDNYTKIKKDTVKPAEV